jgi:hypothetical protein
LTVRGGRPNPETYSGSLIYWLEVPSDQQHFIQGILDGYDGLGYYQTMVHGYGQREDGWTTALARITSTGDGRDEMEGLLEALAAGFGLRLLEEAPGIQPDLQPRSKKPESRAEEA